MLPLLPPPLLLLLPAVAATAAAGGNFNKSARLTRSLLPLLPLLLLLLLPVVLLPMLVCDGAAAVSRVMNGCCSSCAALGLRAGSFCRHRATKSMSSGEN